MTASGNLPLHPGAFRKGPTGSRALRGLLDRKAPAPGPAAGSDLPVLYWDPAFFGLHRARLLRGATEAESRALAAKLGRGILREALAIERTGMVFACRMSLLAESAEEQALFNLFAAEEAAHHRSLAAFLPPADRGPETDPDPFTASLEDMVATGSRGTLLYVVQVILEGWGLRHYRRLEAACLEPALAEVLRGILRDEAAHHGGGRILLSETHLSRDEEEEILRRMRAFLDQVAAGPAALLAACEEACGPLDARARRDLLSDIRAEAETSEKLGILHGLVRAAGVDPITRTLEEEDRFRPRLPGSPT